jgi:hypothetical protein
MLDEAIDEPLVFNAIDERHTRIREDAFIIREIFGEDLQRTIQLHVACIIPPDEAIINRRMLLKNALQRGFDERRAVFFEGNRLSYGFQENSTRRALFTSHTIKGSGVNELDLIEHAGIKDILIDIHHYDVVGHRPWFRTSETLLQEFFAQERMIEKKYKDAYYQVKYGDTESVREKALVNAVLGLFNNVISFYAYQNNVPTLLSVKEGLVFKVNRQARFTAPLRNAIGFINLTNIAHHLQREPIPYNEEKLEELGFRFLPPLTTQTAQ